MIAFVGVAGLSVAWSSPNSGDNFSIQSDTTTHATQPLAGDSVDEVSGGDSGGLDVNTYLGVQRLRGELCLSCSDMAAMGCDVATASALLEGLVTSYETHRAELIASRNRVLQSKGAWRQAMRQTYRSDDTGQALTANQLESLHEDYQRDVTAYHALLENLAVLMSGGLSADQRALWQSAREADRDGRPPELRYAVGMTEGQLEDMRHPGTDGQGRALTPVEAADLRLMQESAIEQARTNRAARYAGVVAAEAAVLPVPPELIEDEAGQLIDDPPEPSAPGSLGNP